MASNSSITATASLAFLAGRSHDSMIFRKGTGDFKDKQGHGQTSLTSHGFQPKSSGKTHFLYTFFSKMKGIQLPMKHGRRLLMQSQGLAQIHGCFPPAWNPEKFDVDVVSANLHSHLIGSFTGQVYSRRFSLEAQAKQHKDKK